MLIFFIFFQKLVVKPDQLIKRRGKLGLIKVNVDFNGVREWLKPRLGENIKVRNFSSSYLIISGKPPIHLYRTLFPVLDDPLSWREIFEAQVLHPR